MFEIREQNCANPSEILGSKDSLFRFWNDRISAVKAIKFESDLATLYLGEKPAIKDLCDKVRMITSALYVTALLAILPVFPVSILSFYHFL
jgi:hypothetical protein